MVLISYFAKTAPVIQRSRRPAMVTYLLLLFTLTFFLQACAPARLTHVLVDDRPATPTEYHKVQIFHKDKPIQTRQEMELQAESVIETDDQSWAVIRFTSGARVILKPGTRVRISSLELIFGDVMAVIDKLQGVFSVKTTDGEAGPRSTVFSVSKAKGGPTVVSVIRGTVEFTSPFQSWKPVIIKQYQRATTSLIDRPVLSTMKSETFNEIVDWGNRVEFAVNPAAARVIVPDIQSLHRTEAGALLEGFGLRVGKVTAKITDARPPIGTVVEQNPSPGTRVQRGAAIDIAVEVKPVQLPQLINKPLSLARNVLLQSELKLGRVDRRITGKAPAETVIDQKPSSGIIVPQGTLVDLVVEEESVVIPNVQRLGRNQASSVLADSRLVVHRWEEQITGTQPPNTVLHQHPRPNGRVRPGTGITLVVEAVSVIVPNIVGYQRNNATAILSQRELGQGQVVEKITGQRPAGTVLYQDPAAGQRVKPGSQVRLHVEAVSMLVPNLVNLSRDAANNTLYSKNLRVGNVFEEVRDNVNDGTVLRQSPPAGQRVALQTPVDMTLAVRGTRIPGLNGQTQGNAVNILSKYGLRLGGVSQRETSRYGWGKVMDQNPPPGTLVRLNSNVDIVIGERAKCYVPNVVGMNVVNADNTIRGARLAPYNSSRVKGTGTRVSSQKPSPGTRLDCGATVSFQANYTMQPVNNLQMLDMQGVQIKPQTVQ